jgi:chromosome segregation ATPase
MSDNLCPKCGKPSTITIGPYYVNDFCQCWGSTAPNAEYVSNCTLRQEIARLKAEVERLYNLVRDDTETYAADIEEVVAERNEARAALEMTENENALWRGHVQKGSVVIAELQSRLEQAERDIETQRKCIGVTADERDDAWRYFRKIETWTNEVAADRDEALAEVDGLKAALEQAERDKSDMWKNLRASIADHNKTIRERDEALENVEQMRSATITALNSSDKVSRRFLAERDEARRLARRFYRMYLIEQENYLDINDDENIWF